MPVPPFPTPPLGPAPLRPGPWAPRPVPVLAVHGHVLRDARRASADAAARSL